MVKYLSFHNSLFCLKIRFDVNGKATLCAHPLLKFERVVSNYCIISCKETYNVFRTWCQSALVS
jgi:hypothetical protein